MLIANKPHDMALRVAVSDVAEDTRVVRPFSKLSHDIHINFSYS